MSQKKKLTPAQREKKQQAIKARKQQKKQTMIKTAAIAGVAILAVILAVILLVTALSDKNVNTSSTGNSGTTQPVQTTAPAEKLQGDGATLDTAVATHIAKIEIKDYGTITLELYGNTAPISVNNFVSLAESGFYNGLTYSPTAKRK